MLELHTELGITKQSIIGHKKTKDTNIGRFLISFHKAMKAQILFKIRHPFFFNSNQEVKS